MCVTNKKPREKRELKGFRFTRGEFEVTVRTYKNIIMIYDNEAHSFYTLDSPETLRVLEKLEGNGYTEHKLYK